MDYEREWNALKDKLREHVEHGRSDDTKDGPHVVCDIELCKLDADQAVEARGIVYDLLDEAYDEGLNAAKDWTFSPDAMLEMMEQAETLAMTRDVKIPLVPIN